LLSNGAIKLVLNFWNFVSTSSNLTALLSFSDLISDAISSDVVGAKKEFKQFDSKVLLIFSVSKLRIELVGNA